MMLDNRYSTGMAPAARARAGLQRACATCALGIYGIISRQVLYIETSSDECSSKQTKGTNAMEMRREWESRGPEKDSKQRHGLK